MQAQACCLVSPSAGRLLSSFTTLWPNTCESFPVLLSFRLGRSGHGIVCPKSLKPACVRPIPCCATCVSVATLVRAHQSSVAAELSTGGSPAISHSYRPARRFTLPLLAGCADTVHRLNKTSVAGLAFIAEGKSDAASPQYLQGPCFTKLGRPSDATARRPPATLERHAPAGSSFSTIGTCNLDPLDARVEAAKLRASPPHSNGSPPTLAALACNAERCSEAGCDSARYAHKPVVCHTMDSTKPISTFDAPSVESRHLWFSGGSAVQLHPTYIGSSQKHATCRS